MRKYQVRTEFIGTKNSYANVAVGLPDLVRYIQVSKMSTETLMKPIIIITPVSLKLLFQSTVDVYSAVKEDGKEDLTSNIRGAFQHLNTGFRTQGPVKRSCIVSP